MTHLFPSAPAGASAAGPVPAFSADDRVRPYDRQPRYWQYRGEPVLFVGGSDDDNLFQWPAEQLEPHLDTLAAAGGNVVRNTMSDRDEGNLRAFAEAEGAPGQYDLARWNPAYWERFDAFLRATHARGILVQIEIWDRFDHSRGPWESDPWNPANNVTYTAEASGLAPAYPEHPGANVQPFFFTVPALDDNRVVRPWQEAFVRRVLEHAAPWPHVLYCIDNETKGREEWATFWAEFVRAETARLGYRVYLTQMWDDWDVRSPMHQRTLAHPERYDYADLSQNNQQVGEPNWTNARVVWRQLAERPRPINSTKIYGSEAYARGGSGKTAANAIGHFWRNLLGGFATSRFHRPTSGLGLSEPALRQIRAVRAWQQHFDVFRAVPDHDHALLADRNPDEAYAMAIPGEAWTVFFPAGGEVGLRVGEAAAGRRWTVRWADLDTGLWAGPVEARSAEGVVRLAPPAGGMALAVVRSE